MQEMRPGIQLNTGRREEIRKVLPVLNLSDGVVSSS